MPRQIYFPPVEPTWDFDRDVVRFYAVVDRMTVVCNVTGEALLQHFGARSLEASEAIQAFKSHRPQIEKAACEKIERDLPPGQREILLGTNDFLTTTTTTPAPVSFSRFEPALSEAVRGSAQIMEVVREANHVLAEDLARGRDHITGEWNLVRGSSSPLLWLILTDKETRVSVEGYFTPEDLRTASSRFALFLLWDELLRKKTAKLLEQALEGD